MAGNEESGVRNVDEVAEKKQGQKDDRWNNDGQTEKSRPGQSGDKAHHSEKTGSDRGAE